MQTTRKLFMLLTTALFFLMVDYPMLHSFSHAESNQFRPANEPTNDKTEWKTFEREERLGDYVIISENEEKQKLPELTSSQRDELKKLHKQLLDSKVQLMRKYEEIGLISSEKAKLIEEKMKKNYQLLEKKQFIPKKHWNNNCRCKEKDEGGN